MNRLILRYATPVTVAILVLFAWVVTRRILDGGLRSLLPLAVAALALWAASTAVFIWVWPRMTVFGVRRSVGREHAMPLPVNALRLLGEDSGGAPVGVLATGAKELIYLGGWLEVGRVPCVVRVPPMGSRYFGIQFTDPASGANVAYIGTRATGGSRGRFLLCAPGWDGAVPAGHTRIDVQGGRALLIGRVQAGGTEDRQAARLLAGQISLEPLDAAL